MASPLVKLRKPAREETGHDDDILLDLSDLPPRVPDGVYRAVLIRHETHFLFRTGKVFLWFRIVDPGEHHGKELYAAYRVILVGKRKFKVKPSSYLFKMMCRVCGVKARPDRLTLLWLKHCVLTVRTRTVTKDSQQKPLPDWLQYSVVDDVLGKETAVSS